MITPFTPQQVFSNYDPTIHPASDIARITERTRDVIDRYLPRTVARYINYQGPLLDNRLHLMAGYREEKTYHRQQQLNTNPPWLNGFEDMLETLPPGDLFRYQISESDQRSLLTAPTSSTRNTPKVAGIWRGDARFRSAVRLPSNRFR